MNRFSVMGLCQIDLPTRSVYLCEGGFLAWGGNTFVSSDSMLGTISSIDALEEGVGNQVPAMQVTMLPPSTSGPADLAQPGWQKCHARFWQANYDASAGTLVGTPEPMFDGFIDQVQLVIGKAQRELVMQVVSQLEQLFEQNIGNSLNTTWHKSIWSGETGHEQANGLTLPVAWGAQAPPQPNRFALAANWAPPVASYVKQGAYYA